MIPVKLPRGTDRVILLYVIPEEYDAEKAMAYRAYVEDLLCDAKSGKFVSTVVWALTPKFAEAVFEWIKEGYPEERDHEEIAVIRPGVVIAYREIIIDDPECIFERKGD